MKVIHFASLLVWSGCLFALPALFAAHRAVGKPLDATNIQAIDMRAMTRFTYIAVASPAAILAIASGTALIHPTGAYAGWMPLKLTLVALMTGLHLLLGRSMIVLHDRPRAWPARHSLLLALAPAPLIVGVLYLVLAKPL